MPALPVSAMTSSWGNKRTTSATLGGCNGAVTGCVAVSVELKAGTSVFPIHAAHVLAICWRMQHDLLREAIFMAFLVSFSACYAVAVNADWSLQNESGRVVMNPSTMELRFQPAGRMFVQLSAAQAPALLVADL